VSRAFVKEDAEADAKVVLPDKPISSHPNYVTPHGLGQLQQGHRDAIAELEDLAGDQSGDGKQRKAQLERDIRYLKARIESAIPVEPGNQPTGVVRFGATVTTVDEEDVERRLTIVGEDEADIGSGQISWVSPLARALQGATVGDVVAWNRPAGELELEVLEIEYL
jgi:transcription elongation factor GreB